MRNQTDSNRMLMIEETPGRFKNSEGKDIFS